MSYFKISCFLFTDNEKYLNWIKALKSFNHVCVPHSSSLSKSILPEMCSAQFSNEFLTGTMVRFTGNLKKVDVSEAQYDLHLAP